MRHAPSILLQPVFDRKLGHAGYCPCTFVLFDEKLSNRTQCNNSLHMERARKSLNEVAEAGEYVAVAVAAVGCLDTITAVESVVRKTKAGSVMWLKARGAGQDAAKSRAWGAVIKGLGHLKVLKTLDLEGMRGVESRAPLGGALARLNKTLKGLEIRDTDWLYPLPNTTGELTGLVGLRISDNSQAVALPEGVFDRLTALDDLRAMGNGQLTFIPGLEKNTALRVLNLSHNNLTAIPSLDWKRSTRLEYLFLQNNRLTQIPAGVQQLTKLKYLDVSGNAIASLDNLNLSPSHRLTSNGTKVRLGGNPVCANATVGAHQWSVVGTSLVKWDVSC